MNGDHLERLFLCQTWQDGGKTTRQHRLPRSGRAHHEERVATGGSNLERSPRRMLADHVGQIVGRVLVLDKLCPSLAHRDAATAQCSHEGGERWRGGHAEAGHKHRLADIPRGDEERGRNGILTHAPDAPRNGEDAANRSQGAVQSQLSQRHYVPERERGKLRRSGEHAWRRVNANLLRSNNQLERRMRENRQSGSVGGEAPAFPTPMRSRR